jgi:multiple sugar transport system ATP-binding protein
VAKVVLQNVYKRFGDVEAVKNVNLEIQDGEFLVLVGPSGCGKTTTLRMIAGLEEISEGKIYIGDRVINDVPPKNRDIAMVFQSYALYPHMNVYENMAFGLKLRGHSKKEIDMRVDEAAEILELKKLMDRLPKQLSGGQRQRVALGRAIVRKPSVFLMDEPLSNLDAKLRVQMRAELQKVHARLKTTIIYVTHDQVEAMTLGNRIAVILNGELQQADKPMSIYTKPANRFVAGFIGSPPMNFVLGKIEKSDRVRFVGQNYSLDIPRDFESYVANHIGQEVICGIRSEDLVAKKNADWVEEKSPIAAKVDYRELMGSEIYFYLKVGANETIIARGESKDDAVPGSAYDVVVNVRKIHLFDKNTQQVIF